MGDMSILTQLGIRHTAARTPSQGTIAVFHTVQARDAAAVVLSAAGYTLTMAGPRGLLAIEPVRPTRFQRAMAWGRRSRGFRIGCLIAVAPVLYISVPLYAWLLWRHVRRTRTQRPAWRPMPVPAQSDRFYSRPAPFAQGPYVGYTGRI